MTSKRFTFSPQGESVVHSGNISDTTIEAKYRATQAGHQRHCFNGAPGQTVLALEVHPHVGEDWRMSSGRKTISPH